MIIWRIPPLANDHPEDPASFIWSSERSGLLKMIIWRIPPLANNHPEDPATCKWSSEGSSLLQMIIQRIRPLANDHLEDSATCKWSSGGTGLLQMIIRQPRHPNHLSQDPYSISRTFLEQFALIIKVLRLRFGRDFVVEIGTLILIFVLFYFYLFWSWRLVKILNLKWGLIDF